MNETALLVDVVVSGHFSFKGDKILTGAQYLAPRLSDRLKGRRGREDGFSFLLSSFQLAVSLPRTALLAFNSGVLFIKIKEMIKKENFGIKLPVSEQV